MNLYHMTVHTVDFGTLFLEKEKSPVHRYENGTCAIATQ